MADKGPRAFETSLIVRAWKDPQFMAELRRNPKAVVQREAARGQSALKIADDVEVTLLEETADHLYLVIPAKPGPEAGALSEAELEAVAGGFITGHAKCTTFWNKNCH